MCVLLLLAYFVGLFGLCYLCWFAALVACGFALPVLVCCLRWGLVSCRFVWVLVCCVLRLVVMMFVGAAWCVLVFRGLFASLLLVFCGLVNSVGRYTLIDG